MPKKYYLVIDTETFTDARLVYDIAGTLIDRKGNIIEQFNYFPAEIVNNPLFNTLLINDSFSKNKADFYLSSIQSENIADTQYIMAEINDIVNYYQNVTIVAYNASFDIKVLNALAQFAENEETFFPREVAVYDLMHMAISAICNTKSYVDFAKQSALLTEKGNISTNAEAVYSFITRDLDFKEEHTALADTEVEAAILTQVFKTHKALKTTNATPIFHCEAWRKVQARAKN